MADPFIAEIRIFGFNFAPKGWAFCNGQLLPISQNTALFSLLGTTYGGDGKSTFALPNLQGSAAIQQGQGPGLSLYALGETGGETAVTLLESEIPAHSHNVVAVGRPGDSGTPANLYVGQTAAGPAYQTALSSPTNMAIQAASLAGGSQPHNNMEPYLVLNFCIAMQGVFPPRT